ncbi:5 -nucleotidase domain-containing 4 isoform X2 [Chlorella sorokiniana]|uniref:5-nucleotidase domain-containing 4 isoform X2 n=1 Tax=Chlorella sorokiniana TaxID=3076 RepID=A0A2P6U4T3_CHLSO|nr:5 -nucleotidase domain-containing 4 isoform X2 [Chlorella sorokiniana]|eukprot:PRW61316.1 5 -nucleotidase domain-containing 4 isoform X2 [Chlorella sorokiniana]
MLLYNKREECDEPDFALIDTLFSLAEAHLFMQLVEMKDEGGHALLERKSFAGIYRPAAASVAGGAPGTRRRLRILMVSHDLTLTGAPQVLYEIAMHLQNQGHNVSVMIMQGGQLMEQLMSSGIPYYFDTDVQHQPLRLSTPVDPGSFDVVIANTVVTVHWLRNQVEAWGLSFLRKAVWWIHEQPLSADDGFAGAGPLMMRHLMARCGAVAIVSQTTKRWWEEWLLQDAQLATCMCSTRSFGRVTVEGMAASLPQLATACGGTLDIVQEGLPGVP